MQRALLGCIVLQVAACGLATSDPGPEESTEVTGPCTLSLIGSGTIPDTELSDARFSGLALRLEAENY